MVRERPPEEVATPVCKFFLDFISMRPTKEECIKAKVVVHRSCTFSMAKRINIPANSWSDVEFVHYPVVAFLEIANHVFIIGVIFVGARPPAHSDL